MRVIDLREQFVVYVIYSGEGKWYVSDKEIWFLDYKKRVEVFRKAGYEIKDPGIWDEDTGNLFSKILEGSVSWPVPYIIRNRRIF